MTLLRNKQWHDTKRSSRKVGGLRAHSAAKSNNSRLSDGSEGEAAFQLFGSATQNVYKVMDKCCFLGTFVKFYTILNISDL